MRMCGFAIAEAPHGGTGLSGWGRTHGKAGLLEMVHLKYLDVDQLPRMEKPWWYRYGADLEKAADAFLRFEFGGGLPKRLRQCPRRDENMFRDRGSLVRSAKGRKTSWPQETSNQHQLRMPQSLASHGGGETGRA